MRVDEELAFVARPPQQHQPLSAVLKTELTEFERRFIERRVSEERSAIEKVAVSAFPLTFQAPNRAMGNATTRLTASSHG
ncbi:hypothetical protein [Bradyrhizobium sp. 39]|uniref:hypothetical protein n=1 Tax=unclassified Bradyrhizobium TaxID=2631580 RepID=UPI0031F7C8C8